MTKIMAALAATVTALALSGCATSNSTIADNGPLTIAKQGSFFVGGRNIESSHLSLLPAYAPSGTIAVEQMYVRFQEPVAAKRPPLVLIHGCCLTGKTWESTILCRADVRIRRPVIGGQLRG